jgi:chorismate mutase / prephenate dehydratase
VSGKTLSEIRDAIDAVDQELQRLINERAALAKAVAEIKLAEAAKTGAAPVFYRPEREAQVLERVMARNSGPLPNAEVGRLFREIMSSCLALEQPLAVGYLGPIGTFTELATLKHFGHAVVARPLTTIADVFREVEAETIEYGVVPIENSTEGMVTHTLECFSESLVVICGEVEMRIHQALMGRSGTALSDVTEVYSHQQSLSQCRQWLDANVPHAARHTASSNAEAARLVANAPESVVWAAVGGERAADAYGLEVLANRIEDQPDNTTRFLVIGRQRTDPSGHDKTSIIVSLKNQPGALYRLLEPFDRRGIDMTRLESRPSHSGVWTYRFFIDFIGHQDEPHIHAFLDELRGQAMEFKVLGSYPKAML